MLLAAMLGFATVSLPGDAIAEDTLADEVRTTEEAENCAACEALIDLALAHPRRAADRIHDRERRPAETLALFRVRPGMTVVDFDSPDGWYEPILAPYLGEDGRYIGAREMIASGSADRVMMVRPRDPRDFARRLVAAQVLLKPTGLLCIEQRACDVPRPLVVSAVEGRGFALVAADERMTLLFRKRA
jgi:hypothetical protein